MNSKSDLIDEDFKLIEIAKETADRLHFDNVHEVAAALLTKQNKIFTGIHIDANVGFADICGEVSAICHAVAHGHRDFKTILAVWGDGEGSYELLSPCGRCREVISDFSKDIWVIVGPLENPYKVKISDLLPLKYKALA
jgi:cytidine deaminase